MIEWLREMAEQSGIILLGYGTPKTPDLRKYALQALSVLLESGHGSKFRALRTSADGTPWHPLYVPDAVDPVPWKPSYATLTDILARDL